MRTYIFAAVVCLTALLAPKPAASLPEPMGIGSCYEPQPICTQGRPVCMCDVLQNCFWACR